MKTVVVIPAYNEAPVLSGVVKDVRTQVPHVVVVDDGSTDETAVLALRAGATVLRHSLNRGQGAALQTGIDAALADGADIVVTFDADGQMQAADIPAVVAPVASGLCEVSLGSRFLTPLNTIPKLRRLTLKAALAFTKLTTGLRISDTHNGLRAFSRSAAQSLSLRCDRMAHASEILEHIAALKLRFREVPVTVRYTPYSMHKGQKLSGTLKIVRDLLISSWLKH